jgi:YegS/Rv2252/BmrU family lipid kinase
MKKRIRFIVNPYSGVHKHHAIKDLIAQELDTNVFDYDICETEYAGHATELANEAATEGYDVVVAVGGDGSVNEVAAGLVGSKTVLGMLPAGSGNGFAMHLGWGRDITSVIRRLSEAKIETVDTCAINGRLFVNLAGVGFEATVANQIRGVKKRGFQAYFKSYIDNIFNYKTKKYHIQVDDKILETEALNVTVANAPMYGYNFVVAPLAKLNDGELEVVVIHKAAWWQYLTQMPRMLTNSFHKGEIVERMSGRRVEIGLNEPDYAQFDGEGFAVTNKKLVFTINPGSLNVLVPSNSPAMAAAL